MPAVGPDETSLGLKHLGRVLWWGGHISCTLETNSPVAVLNAPSQRGFRCTPANTPAVLLLCAVVFLLTDHRSKSNLTSG